MARGDLSVFEEHSLDLGHGYHDYSAHTLKLALVDNTGPPGADQATPIWADFSANEVSGTGYTAGGIALTGLTWTEAAGVATLDDTVNVTWSQNGAGPTDIYWGILYNDTQTSPADPCICLIDMGGPVSLQDGDVTVTWHTNGILTVTVS